MNTGTLSYDELFVIKFSIGLRNFAKNNRYHSARTSNIPITLLTFLTEIAGTAGFYWYMFQGNFREITGAEIRPSQM